MIRLQVISGRQAGASVSFCNFPVRLGRGAATSMTLADPGVWDEHCRIEYRAGDGFSLIPNPPAETRLNATVLSGAQRLLNGAEIELGATRLRFSLADPAPRRQVVQEAIAWTFLVAAVAVQGWLVLRVLP